MEKITTIYDRWYVIRACIITGVICFAAGSVSYKIKLGKIDRQSIGAAAYSSTDGIPLPAPPSQTDKAMRDILVTARDLDKVRAEIISLYSQFAIEEMHKSGYPASVKMAQMILEAGFSERTPRGSKIFNAALNPFGIKYWKDNHPERIENWDALVDGYIETSTGKYVKFPNIAAAFNYHSQFVVKGKHYNKHVYTGSWEDWLYALEQGGYAEDPLYRSKLMKIIVDYELYKLDNL
jgi:hypothetical protein